MSANLNDTAVRVLGSLMEKALATPEYYPLSLNALTAACNQKSSRDPVVSYDEAEVQAAADELGGHSLLHESRAGRVSKFEEGFSRRHSLVPAETAVLCVLLLRGAQTIGEIRTRTSRLYAFPSLEAVQASIETLEDLKFVRRLERLPGHKESRYVHLLSGEPEALAPPDALKSLSVSVNDAERIERLEAAVTTMQAEIVELKAVFTDFKKQFE